MIKQDTAVTTSSYMRLTNASEPVVDETLLQELKHLWEPHQRQGLEVRYRTGVLLNEKFGDPCNRQAYGAATLKRYATALGVAESELSRMRRFASSFGSVQELQARHPDVVTWTQVKTLLAKSNDQGRAASASPAPQRRPQGPADCALRAIRSLRKQVGGLHLEPSDPMWKKMHRAVNDMIAAAARSLGVEIAPLAMATSGQVASDSQPPIGETEQAATLQEAVQSAV